MKRSELTLESTRSNRNTTAGSPASALADTEYSARGTVILLDEDDVFLKHVERILLPTGLRVYAFNNVEDFFLQPALGNATCLVLETRLRIVSGLDLQRHLALTGNPMPLLFVTSLDSAEAAVQAIKAGAINYLVKPLHDDMLVQSILEAIEHDEARRRNSAEATHASAGVEALTPREREVVELIAAGKLNKQVAFELGISEMTVKVHRGRVMKKMGARTVVELIRKFDRTVKCTCA